MNEPLPEKLSWWVATRSPRFTVVAFVGWSLLGAALWIPNLVLHPTWLAIGIVAVGVMLVVIYAVTLVYLLNHRTPKAPTADRWHEE